MRAVPEIAVKAEFPRNAFESTTDSCETRGSEGLREYVGCDLDAIWHAPELLNGRRGVLVHSRTRCDWPHAEQNCGIVHALL